MEKMLEYSYGIHNVSGKKERIVDLTNTRTIPGAAWLSAGPRTDVFIFLYGFNTGSVFGLLQNSPLDLQATSYSSLLGQKDVI